MNATLTKKLVTADVRVKDADQGIVELVFSTFNKVDKDGDVTLKGAFVGNPPIVLSAYGHKSWDGELPYGTGTITEGETEATASVKFLLNTTHGRDAFETVKALSEAGLQEWSYSLESVEAERGTVDGKSVRILKKIFVKEISPVLRGAGTDTRTLAVKSFKQLDSDLRRNLRSAASDRWGDDQTWVWVQDFDIDDSFVVVEIEGGDEYRLVQVDFTRNEDGTVTLADNESDVQQVTSYAPKGAKFSEQTDSALRGVKQLVEMAVERLTHRAAEGKAITEQTEALGQLLAELEPLKQAIDATQVQPLSDIEREFLRFVASSQGDITS